MLGNYEKRYFSGQDTVYVSKYRNLSNVLHWHSECELIRIDAGYAEVKIENQLFAAKKGDCFFCGAEDLHYIKGQTGAVINVMILRSDLAKSITERYALVCPKLSNASAVSQLIDRINCFVAEKPLFYKESIETTAKAILIDIFSNNKIIPQEKRNPLSKAIVDKINEDFAQITFSEIVQFSGYSPSHFSKMFKNLSGMNFSEYLNCIKIETAISLLQSNPKISKTEVCAQCGFQTIRTFNRVFKQLTGYTPSTLPKEYNIEAGLRISKSLPFDPTARTSERLQ